MEAAPLGGFPLLTQHTGHKRNVKVCLRSSAAGAVDLYRRDITVSQQNWDQLGGTGTLQVHKFTLKSHKLIKIFTFFTLRFTHQSNHRLKLVFVG